MDSIQILYFIIASVLLTLAPGPDILYLLAKSLASGVKSGVVLAAGLCSGLVVHTALVACGVAAIISNSPVLFQLLKWVGAIYLVYLAILSLRENSQLQFASVTEANQECYGSLYRRGVMMNLLNPKVILFFLAFLPQFVHPENGGTASQVVILGIIFGIQAFLIFSFVAYLAGAIRQKIQDIPNFPKKMGIVQGIVLFCIAGVLVIE